MKLRVLTCITAISLLAALTLPQPCRAQQELPRYTVQDLGTLGGSFSWAYGINNKGSVSGMAYLFGDTAVHAFLWQNGRMTSLGTLGGSNSWAIYKPNDSNAVVGGAETSFPDPSGEDFCNFGFGTNLTCVPFLWRQGVMTSLPTLGGNNGTAGYINNRGQIVGAVENTTPDSCGLNSFEIRPVLWQHGQINELPLLASDTNGVANSINDNGRAVGWSGCTPFLSSNAVLWERGTVTSLGNMGGASGANGINNRGQIFGYSYLSDNMTFHAVLWERDMAMRDLGMLSGDAYSEAWGIDDKGRVVGGSYDANYSGRAFLWQDGVMVDLNTLIPADSQWFLVEADGINAGGEIVGLAFNMATGEAHAFLATPKGSVPEADAFAAQVARPTPVLPKNVLKMVQQRMIRHHAGLGGHLPQ